jgi:hypothetical protein
VVGFRQSDASWLCPPLPSEARSFIFSAKKASR